jgi:hypothetical protein
MTTKMEIGDIRVCKTNSSYDASQSRGVIVRITRKDSKRYSVETEVWSRWTGDTGETSWRIFRSFATAEAYAEKVCRTGFGDCEWDCE